MAEAELLVGLLILQHHGQLLIVLTSVHDNCGSILSAGGMTKLSQYLVSDSFIFVHACVDIIWPHLSIFSILVCTNH